MNAGREILETLVRLPEGEAERILRELAEDALRRFDKDWPAWVRAGQSPPEGADWRVWLMMAGRGFGKTRAGAEWVSQLARDHPGAAIALVAATADEARRVMVEGRSGLIAVARAAERRAMCWEPSRRRLRFAGGAEAFLYSGANADSLRGPEHHFAWCDELAKWRQAGAAWDNLMLGLRCGERPRALVTTTPRPIAALRAILADPATAPTGGPMSANPHVAAAAVADLERRLGGTRLGRQELEGELLEDIEGALWTRGTIEACRMGAVTSDRPLARIVVGVDPPAGTQGDACGIVVCGVDSAGTGYVLEDASVAGLSPDGWARKVAAAAGRWGAHRVIAEKNNGGDMVEAVLRGADAGLPVTPVHAADGKAARAEPVAVLFEKRKARFAGAFPELEDQLAGFTYAGYAGAGSPDRADAMIWAMTELIVKPQRAEPRVRTL